MASSPSYAFVTLLTSDSYLPGALALVAALHEVHRDAPSPPELPFSTVCLVTPETVDVSSLKALRLVFDLVVGVEIISQIGIGNGLELLGRPDLHQVLTKLHVLRLTQFDKIIFLDADVLPIRPISHLFTLPHEFSASPDVGWPDIFNSGVMVLEPGEDKFTQVMDLAKSKGSWDGGDQGILNEWRGQNWGRISFTYNTTPTAAYTYAPAYERFGSQIHAIHFIGTNKPWNGLPWRAAGSAAQVQPTEGSSTTSVPQSPIQGLTSYGYPALVDRWYDVYDRNYRALPPQDADGSLTAASHPPGFTVPRYTSAWDRMPRRNTGGGPGGSTMNLDSLKQLALQGVHAVTSAPAYSLNTDSMGLGFVGPPPPETQVEARYVTMPLEGRAHLLTTVEQQAQNASIGKFETPSQPHHDRPPSPGPPGSSPALDYLNGDDLPPHLTQRPDRPPSPPGPHPFHVYHQQRLQQQQQGDPTPEADGQVQTPSEQHFHRGGVTPQNTRPPPHSWVQQTEQQQSWVQPQATVAQASNSHTPFQRRPLMSSLPSLPSRPPSPPMITWNAAIEAPPTSLPPGPTHHHSAQHYRNVWDIPRIQARHPKPLRERVRQTGQPLPPPPIPHFQQSSPEPTLQQEPLPTTTQFKPGHGRAHSISHNPHHVPSVSVVQDSLPTRSQVYQEQRENRLNTPRLRQTSAQSQNSRPHSPTQPFKSHHQTSHPPRNPPQTHHHPHYEPRRVPFPQSDSSWHDPLTSSPPNENRNTSDDPAPETFFRPPERLWETIPRNLIAEGHYSAVINQPSVQEYGHIHRTIQPSAPDPTKVSPLFPWERQPHRPPSRRFPQSSTPPPNFLVPKPPSPPPILQQSPPPAPRVIPQSPPKSPKSPVGPPVVEPVIPKTARVWTSYAITTPPTAGVAGSASYANAWDTVPSIQKYASRLIGPNSIAALISPSIERADLGRQTGNSPPVKMPWEDRADVESEDSSHDGDDEDEDSEDSDTIGSPSRRGGSNRPGSRSGKSSASHSRRGSTATNRSSASTIVANAKTYNSQGVGTHGTEPSYRSQGVQTVAKTTQTRGVQVNRPSHVSRRSRTAASISPVIDTRPLPSFTGEGGSLGGSLRARGREGRATPPTFVGTAQTPFGASTSFFSSRRYGDGPLTESPTNPTASTPFPRIGDSPTGATSFRDSRLDSPVLGIGTSPSILTPAADPSTGLHISGPRPRINFATFPRNRDSTSTLTATNRDSMFTATSGNRDSMYSNTSIDATGMTPVSPTKDLLPGTLPVPFLPHLRTSSNETGLTGASGTSPPSSRGPASPIEIEMSPPRPPPPSIASGSSTFPSRKPAGRTWDPQRGVDVFKRDSQEVLAKFLRMGSWGEGGSTEVPVSAHTPPMSGSPSVGHGGLDH